MNKLTERMFDINKRKAEIRSNLEANKEGIDIDALTTELNNLNTEFSDIEKRMKLTDSITITKPEERKDNNNMDNNTYAIDSAEYRDAFCNKLLGKTLNEAETRAISSTGAAIPTIISDQLITKVKTLAPMLNEITLLNVAGAVTFMVEGVRDDAAIHTENANITGASDALVKVTLGSYEFVKVISISKTVSTMSIPAFEGWLTDILAEDIARRIENCLVNGTGTNQPQGVATANTWDDTNSVTVGANGSLTVSNVTTFISLLPAAYDVNGKILMSKKTLFTDFMPLKDDSKYPLVKYENGEHSVFGYPILISDYVPLHEAYIGDFKKIVGNLSQDIAVESSAESGFLRNAIDFKGTAQFDSKVALGEAFVKLAKATA